MRKYRLDIATQGRLKVACIVPDEDGLVYTVSEVEEFKAAVGKNTQLLLNRVTELEQALSDLYMAVEENTITPNPSLREALDKADRVRWKR